MENLSTSVSHVKRFKRQEVSHEETPSFPCADGTLKIFDLPRPRHGENLAGGNLELDDLELDEGDTEEETIFEEESGHYRHHEVHRTNLYVQKEETFPCACETRRRDETNANQHKHWVKAHVERLLDERCCTACRMDWNDKIPNLEDQALRRYTWVNGRPSKLRHTTRPDTFWLKEWPRLSEEHKEEEIGN